MFGCAAGAIKPGQGFHGIRQSGEREDPEKGENENGDQKQGHAAAFVYVLVLFLRETASKVKGKRTAERGKMDAPRGFEPRLTDSESAVLPLDDGAKERRVLY